MKVFVIKVKFSSYVVLLVSFLGLIGIQESAKAYRIVFDTEGIFSHAFAPPNGAGAIEYKNTPGLNVTNIEIINPNGSGDRTIVPADRSGTNLLDPLSPISVRSGNPGIARVITDLAIGHGSSLSNLESDGSTPAPRGFVGPAGNLSQSFSASGFWRVVPEPGDPGLRSVALNGLLRGDVQLDPPFFGSATASVSGNVLVEPFGSFTFTTGERSNSGSFGLSASTTGGGISFSPPSITGTPSSDVIVFTDLRNDVEINRDYRFTLSGSLSASLSDLGIISAASIANLWTQEFELRALPCSAGVQPNEISSFLGIAQTDRSGSCLDLGDLPDSYRTLIESDGPRYQEGELQRLGNIWDTEINGQPTPLADGDDRSILGGCRCIGDDDEDGVIFGDSWVDVTFNIARPENNLYQLRAWWDFGMDGFFDHTGDLVIDDLLTLAPGILTKRYDLGFNPKKYNSRFRLTLDPLDLDVKPWGEVFSNTDCSIGNTENCISHGEVEDYPKVPEPNSTISFLVLTILSVFRTLKCRSKT